MISLALCALGVAQEYQQLCVCVSMGHTVLLCGGGGTGMYKRGSPHCMLFCGSGSHCTPCQVCSPSCSRTLLSAFVSCSISPGCISLLFCTTLKFITDASADGSCLEAHAGLMNLTAWMPILLLCAWRADVGDLVATAQGNQGTFIHLCS